MNRKVTIVIAMMLLTLEAYSQAGFYPGYIVKKDGDTIHGLIYLSTDRYNLKYCQFRRFELAIPRTYLPNDLRAYVITGKRAFQAGQNEGKAVFEEVLVKGEYSLIKLDDRYILEHKGEENMLLNKAGIRRLSEKQGGHINADTIPLKESSLINLVCKLNQLNDSPSLICKRDKSLKPILDYTLMKNQNEFGVLIGSDVDMSGSFHTTEVQTPYDLLTNTSFKAVSSPEFGVYYVRHFLLHPRVAFVTDLIYTNRFLHASSYSSESSKQTWNDAFLNLHNVMVSVMIRRYFSAQSNRFYLQGGLVGSLIATGTMKEIADQQVGLSVDEAYYNYSFKSDQYAGRLGIGWEKALSARKFFIQAEAKYGISESGFYYRSTINGTSRIKLFLHTPQVQLTAGIKL